jgi:hypothetical protein
MSRRSVPRGLIWSTAFFGVFVGHAVTYVLLAGNPVVRASMLASTGHGYLPVVTHGGLILAVIGLAGIFLTGLGGGTHVAPSGRALVGRVSAFQVLTFAAIEVAERIAVHASLRDLPHVLPVGTAVQIAVACAVAAVIRLVLRAADAASEARAAAPLHRPRALVPVGLAPAFAVASADHPIARDRGPPS